MKGKILHMKFYTCMQKTETIVMLETQNIVCYTFLINSLYVNNALLQSHKIEQI